MAYKLENKVHYAIEGSIYSCGNIVKWLRDEMKFFNDSKQSEKFINKNGDTNKVLFLPAFNGLGAPFWNSDIRGGFYGITQDTTIEDMTSASFQAITFQTKEITTILEKYDMKISKLLVDGGMTQNNTFCQILSDTLQKEIIKPANVESTAIGACKVAMIGSGNAIKKIPKPNQSSFSPNTDLAKTYEDNHYLWQLYLKNSIKAI